METLIMMGRELHHILLVEDDPDIQEVAQMSLEVLGGFKVDSCSSGVEALEYVTQVIPDMILLDFMMPGMDGAETLAALRSIPSLAAVPVVFMTARVRQTEVEAYGRLGAAGVISKPFDPTELPGQLRALWVQADVG